MQLSDMDDHVYVIANSWTGDLEFELPSHLQWTVFADTSDEGRKTVRGYVVRGRSVVILEGR